MDRNKRLKKTIDALIPWFRENGRSLPWREDRDPYHVWVSEIMLQQTRIETVIPYYRRFLSELPDIRALSEADPEHLQKLWEGLGYYSRVRNLQKAACEIMEKHDGIFPGAYEKIRSLPGIGDYTAGAVASICFDLPVPAVDGNVLRVLSRITGDRRPVTEEKTKKEVRAELCEIYPKKDAGLLTEAIMELGEIICLPNGTPDCEHCPCRAFCQSSTGDWAFLPVKAQKKERKQELLTVFLLHEGERTAIRKRPEKGLLSGQWELPNVPGHLSLEEAREILCAWGCCPEAVKEKGLKTHIFTHIEWDMKCIFAECKKMPPDFLWADKEELKTAISLPTAFRKLL